MYPSRAITLNLKTWLLFAALLVPCLTRAQQNILTSRYDNFRTGANLKETTLNVANVSASRFEKLYSYPVDGAVLAQPLYVSGVVINGATHNVLYVATMNDKVYAFDADLNAPPLWTRDFTNPPSVTFVPLSDIEPLTGGDLPNIGVQSTPVIDANTGTMYVVARTKESGSYFQRLHALDIATGLERAGSPVVITAKVSGTAPDAVNNTVTFNPKMQNQRVGLALSNGIVVIAWASHDDIVPYHGWVMGYDAATLAQVGVFCATPDYNYGGIWQSGRAPAIDSAGNFYFSTGNAVWDGVRNWGDSILKLSVTQSGISMLDWFAPSDWNALFSNDTDLGSTGVTLLPNTNLLVGGGKGSTFYLLDINNLGHESSNDSQIIQKLYGGGGPFMGGPAYWNSAAAGPLLYNWAETDVLRAYHFNGVTLDTAPYASGSDLSPGHPGGALTISANGNVQGTGIVWASLPTNQSADVGFVAGILRAYNADTLQEIWDTEKNPARDRLGSYMRFVPPSVVNGKVYMPSYDNAVVVYGLLPTTPDFTISATPATQTVSTGQPANYTVTVGAVNGFVGVVAFGVSGLPTGATATFSPSSVTGSGSVALQIVPGSSTPVGNYTVTVTGTSGGLSHSISVIFSVTANLPTLIDAQGFGDRGTASTTVTTNSFSTTAGGELLLTFIATDAQSGSNTIVTGVSGGGLSWSRVIQTNAQRGTSEIWRAFATSPLSNVSVTATLLPAVASSIAVMSFKNVDTSGTNGTGAIGAMSSASSSSGAPTATLKTTRKNSLVVGVGNDFDNAIARVPGSNQTVFHQFLAPVGDTYWMQMQNSPTAVAGTSVTINDTAPVGDRYNLSIVEVLPAAVVVPTYTISGTITPAGNAASAVVALAGPSSASTTADFSGNYSFSGLANGTYTVTPSKTGFTFTPTSQPVTVNNANVGAVNFSATAQTWSISGNVSVAGAGATVTLSGAASASTTADSSGNYSFAGLANGSYTLTPAKSGVTFTPTSQVVNVSNGNVSGVNFAVASGQTWSISGNLSTNGAGASVALSGTASGIVTASSGTSPTLIKTCVVGSEAASASISTASCVNTAGDFLIITTTAVRPASTVTLTDTVGDVFVNANSTIYPFHDTIQDGNVYVWYVPVAKGGSPNIFTTVPGSGNSALEIHVSEWSGMQGWIPDQSAIANGATGGLSFSSGSQVTTTSPELIFGYTFPLGNSSPGAGFTALSNVNGDWDEYQMQNAAGSVAATFTSDNSGSWLATMVTFKPPHGYAPPGSYSFTGLPNGSYTVTPTKSGYNFTPTSQSVSVNNTNVTNLNFTAAAVVTQGGPSIDSKVSIDTSAKGNTIASPAFSTTAGNELVLALVSTDYVSGANTTVNGITGAGLTWTLVLRTNVQSGSSEIWRAFAPSTITGAAVTATLSQSVVASMTVMSFKGVDTTGTNGSGAIGAVAGTNAKTGAPSATLITTRNNSLVLGVGNDYDNAINRTPGPGQTVVHQDLTSTGDTYWVQMQISPTPLSGTSVTINDTAPTGDRYNLSVVEVRTP